MYILSRNGFVSIVADSSTLRMKGDQLGETMSYIVRARDRGSLSFFEGFDSIFEVVHTPEADYPFRVFVDDAALNLFFSYLQEDLNYTNFKLACSDRMYPVVLRTYEAATHLQDLDNA